MAHVDGAQQEPQVASQLPPVVVQIQDPSAHPRRRCAKLLPTAACLLVGAVLLAVVVYNVPGLAMPPLHHSAVDAPTALIAKPLMPLSGWGFKSREVELDEDPQPHEILLKQLQEIENQDPQRQSTLHASLANVYADQGLLSEAQKHYEVAVKLASHSDDRVTFQVALGSVKNRQGNLPEALHILQAASSLALDEDLSSVRIFHAMGNVHREMGHISDALDHYTQARVVAEIRSEEDMDVLPLLAADTADAYARKGDGTQALRWLKTAIQHWEATRARMHQPRGEPDAVFGMIQSLFGAAHGVRGDAKQSRAHFEKAMQVQTRLLPPAHTDLVGTRMGLARAKRDAGDAASALEAIEAVERTIRSGPMQGPDIGRALVLKAEFLREAARFQDAVQAVEEGLRIFTATFGGQSHPEMGATLNTFGSILQDQGRFQEAQAKYEEAMTVLLASVGEMNPEVAATHNSLATLFQDTGNFKDADIHLHKCLEIQLATVGAASPDVANTYNNIGTVAFLRGLNEEAAEMCQKALRVLDAAGVPKGNPERAIYQENLDEIQMHIRGQEKMPSAPAKVESQKASPSVRGAVA